MTLPDSFSNVVESAKNWVSQVFSTQQASMSDSRPRDVQILPIATNTKVMRARSKSRLRFEIEYALERGTTSNSYLIESDKTAITDPPAEGFTEIYLEALQKTINVQKLDYVILGHFNPNRIPTLKAILQFVRVSVEIFIEKLVIS